MILTGKQAHDKLVEAEKLINEVKSANIVDCNNDYILLIAVISASIKYVSTDMDRIYHDLYEKAQTPKTDEITPDGTQLRYTAVLRPTQNIDADWLKMSFNDRPGMNEEIYYRGHTYKVTSVRKNF